MAAASSLVQPLYDIALDQHRNGRLREAAAAYTRLLSIMPTHAGCHHMISVIARQAGDNGTAVAALRKAVTAAPLELLYRRDLLDTLQRLGQDAEAKACLKEMCLLFPNEPDLLIQYAAVLREAGENRLAVDYLRSAAALAPDNVDAHGQLGLNLLGLGDLEGARDSLMEAIRLRPATEAAHNNLGLVLLRLGEFAAAENCFRIALRLAPERAMTLVNLGNVLRVVGQVQEAEACFRHALQLSSDHPEAHYSLGSLMMLEGRLAEGWPEMEWRDRCFPQREVPGPAWRGEALNGRVLLLYSDQGFGDAIQFCRYAPALAQRERVVLEVPKWLTRLMHTLDGVSTIVARDEELPPYDLQCAFARLPLIAGTTLENIPAAVPYLHAEERAVQGWRQRLAPIPGLRVGLVWAGNPAYPDDRRRSVTLQDLAPLASVPGVAFISLQKLLRSEQAVPPPPGMIMYDWTADLQDFADTAALVMALDLVIAVDTAVAHLAGALGRPVWLLNRLDTDWRWLRGRNDSPWYPTMRLFRQTEPRGWDAPVAAMRAELSRLSASPSLSSYSG